MMHDNLSASFPLKLGYTSLTVGRKEKTGKTYGWDLSEVSKTLTLSVKFKWTVKKNQ